MPPAAPAGMAHVEHQLKRCRDDLCDLGGQRGRREVPIEEVRCAEGEKKGRIVRGGGGYDCGETGKFRELNDYEGDASPCKVR